MIKIGDKNGNEKVRKAEPPPSNRPPCELKGGIDVRWNHERSILRLPFDLLDWKKDVQHHMQARIAFFQRMMVE